MQITVSLAPWDREPATDDDATFIATIAWEYRTAAIQKVMRFACTSDLDEYAELLRDPTTSNVWYFQATTELTGASKEAYDLVQFSANGRQLSARHTARAGMQSYTVTLPDEVMNEAGDVTFAYAYRVLVKQHNHLLHLDLSKPTKDVKIQFFYGDCGIRRVSVLDYFSSARQPRVTRLPASGPTPSIELNLDGWVMPKAGVGFVWVLDGEELASNPGRTA